jgi:hypothetical protein
MQDVCLGVIDLGTQPPRCGRAQAAPSNRPGSQSTQWDARRPAPAATSSRWRSEEITSSTPTAAPVRLIARNSTRAGLQFSRWARLSHPKMDHRTAHVSKQRTVKLYRMASKSADWPTFGPCTQAGRDRSAPGTPRCQTVSTSGGGEPVNAYVIALDTAAAAALAALAAGLIIAGRRGPRAPFPGLTGSLPCRQQAHAGWLHLTFTSRTHRDHASVL